MTTKRICALFFSSGPAVALGTVGAVAVGTTYNFLGEKTANEMVGDLARGDVKSERKQVEQNPSFN